MRGEHIVYEHDQLKRITDKLGKPSPEDTSFITDQTTINHLSKMSLDSPDKHSLPPLSRHSDPEVCDLLSKMLHFNPYLRPSAKELI